MGDIGIATEEFENVIKTAEDYFNNMEIDINRISDFVNEIKGIFNSNDMQKVSKNLESIIDSYQNIKSVTASYITSLKGVKNSYTEQAQIVANELNRLSTN